MSLRPIKCRNGGVDVAHPVDILHGFEPEFVGGAHQRAALYTAAREPHRHGPRIVVAAGIVAPISAGLSACAEFAHPHHQRDSRARGASDLSAGPRWLVRLARVLLGILLTWSV